jgi:hypothetical protein
MLILSVARMFIAGLLILGIGGVVVGVIGPVNVYHRQQEKYH